MQYIEAIKTSILLFPIIALIILIPFLLYQYHRYTSINPLRVFIIYSMILYLITIYFLVILPLPSKTDVIEKTGMIRLIPFTFIKDIISNSEFLLNDSSTYFKFLTKPAFYTVIFNIIMMVPLGIYLKYYFNCSLKKTTLITFLLSLFFELTQLSGLYFIYPYPYRVFDVDDLIINTLGGILGYFLAKRFLKFLPTREEIDFISYQKGEIISGLRRIFVFFLDIFLYLIISSTVNLFIKCKYLYLIIFFRYYVRYPYFKEGETLGSKFLKVRLVFEKRRFFNLLFRIIFLFIYYFGIFYFLLILSNILKNDLNLDIIFIYGFNFFVIIFIICFYIIISSKNETNFIHQLEITIYTTI